MTRIAVEQMYTALQTVSKYSIHDRKVMAPLKPIPVCDGLEQYRRIHDRKVMAPLKLNVFNLSVESPALYP